MMVTLPFHIVVPRDGRENKMAAAYVLATKRQYTW